MVVVNKFYQFCVKDCASSKFLFINITEREEKRLTALYCFLFLLKIL